MEMFMTFCEVGTVSNPWLYLPAPSIELDMRRCSISACRVNMQTNFGFIMVKYHNMQFTIFKCPVQ